MPPHRFVLSLVVVLLTAAACSTIADHENAITAQHLPKPEIAPKVLHMERPVLPESLESEDARATVEVLFIVEPDGSVQETVVESPHPLLTAAALDCLKKWTFKPGMTGGVAVRSVMQVAFNFGGKDIPEYGRPSFIPRQIAL